MNLKEIVQGKSGEKLFLLGNEAAVRGALEAGISVAATYPGTPSSEIGDVFSKIANDASVYFEFSINEKVAMEVAAAAAASGVRSFTFMKHVGLNVASDSFMSVVYTGVRGGMIILSADDPSMFSSQNEQDNRHYARLANLPVLEPSNPQEIKDFMKYGYQISEEFQIPILLRTTTRVSHMRGIVELGDIPQSNRNNTEIKESNNSNIKGFFHKNPSKFVPVPATARIMHKDLVEKMENILEVSNNSDLNIIYYNGQVIKKDSDSNLDLNFDFKGANLGIVTSGGAFNYAFDVVEEMGLNIPLLKLGFTYPFPKDIILKFAQNLDKLLVVEEVDPIMENEILKILGAEGLCKKVHGKLDDSLSLIYEFNQDIVKESIIKVLNLTESQSEAQDSNLKTTKNKVSDDLALPNRPPTLCPGCPHRAVYYSIKKARENLNINEEDLIFPTDIGCYTLGIESPYQAADYLLAMGSSIGTSCGFSKATNQNIVCFLGDSTFFHSGIPPLINAVHNKHNFVLTVLDNRTTAMTGGQPHPGLPIDGMGEVAPEISIENMVKATGAEFVETINPLSIKKTVDTFERALKYDGVAVIISRYPCVLIKNKETSKKETKKAVMAVDSEKCSQCMECISKMACPAIYETQASGEQSIEIDVMACKGCTVCVQMCPEKAIRVRK
ncbi:MAG: indolepyruvate ferredoxin oxidoreductase subunit alpha [Methanobacteriaceae archaeon]|nr:indolepyruvate ferredoxin oxidoreductase subunit alpha [Methanobacteriaceae archaeon]MDP2836810.1 indolepyruvate ferredoxin oxidoreductase subunit alpha [Methanobacteriaceae archaeon]MDP3033923.1 indolepyruvate ferredoxin oxidoreductase subunit alpha [Methanobacteriaceae archaeon]MDP3622752.1 indolepyruvate ferredoxin oxidoreductase subunit alpha [Methanobacteriaceae archaeon]